MPLKTIIKRAVLATLALLSLSVTQAAETPRLVVMIMVDGLQVNELEAYAGVLGKNGLLYLTQNGMYNKTTECSYLANDITTHYASLYTGSTPRYHGIVSDRFYSMVDDDIVSCIADARHSGINTDENVSPRLLQATTITDQVKMSYPESKVFSIGLRPESSIMMGGHLADGAVWISSSTGKWATSTYYNNGMPLWAEQQNNDSSIVRRYQRAWYAAKNLRGYQFAPAKSYYGEDIPAFEKFKSNDPTWLNIEKLRHTPMVNDAIKELAVNALRSEQLGTDNAPDVLCVEFNAHIPGETTKMCAEKEDLLIRLDENIERLLEAIEISVGIDNSIIVLAAPTVYREPSTLESEKINHGTFKAERSMALLNAYLMAIYGQGRWVTGYYNQNIYLNKRLIEDNKIRINEISDYAAQFITEFTGVHSAIPAYQIRMASSLPSDLPSRIRNSHYGNRSGDVVFTLLPGWTETTSNGRTLASTLATSLMPVAIIAPGIEKANTPIRTEDLCPTLCNLLHIPLPNACIGKVKNL